MRCNWKCCLLLFVAQISVSDEQVRPLNCGPDEAGAYVIQYGQYRSRLGGIGVDDLPNVKGFRSVIVTADTFYSDLKGEQRDIPAMFRGEVLYKPYFEERWKTKDRIYTYRLDKGIGRVRQTFNFQKKPILPYRLPEGEGELGEVAETECRWVTQVTPGVQRMRFCHVYFYGWQVLLLSHIDQSGKEGFYMSADQVDHRCVDRSRVAIPEDRLWRY